MITHTTLLWGGFILFILAMLAIDLGLFSRKRHVMTLKEALTWFGVWVGLAMVFNLGVFFFHPRGAEAGLEYFAGYLIEKSLAVDNIFVFVLVFSYFNIPRISQHKVLMWGVLGALVFRAIFIVGGLALLERFHWMIYLFGLLLLVTGVHMLFKKEDEAEIDPQKTWAIRAFQKVFPVTAKFDRDRFFTRENGRLMATPLLVALVAIETSDIVFAVDSIPAIFAVTPDPFIVFSSNIFAILGLRSLYFAVSGVLGQFHFLRYGFASILLILSAKMLLSGVVKVPIAPSLVLIVFILLVCVILSVLRPRKADLKGVFARTARLGLIPFRRLLMIENILDRGDLPLRGIMRKRDAVRVLRAGQPWPEMLEMLRATRFSRYPLLNGEGDQPLGILHLKDLAVAQANTEPDADRLQQLARPGLVFQEDVTLTEALGRFRKGADDMGLVFDQQGAWVGIATLEDLIEQVVGEIDDTSPVHGGHAPFVLADALSPARIVLDLHAASLREAIETVLASIPEEELPLDRATLLQALTRHSEEMTNYLGKNVAVPHARLEGVEKPLVIFARSQEGVDLGFDNQHADFLFLAVSPPEMTNGQARLLASISSLAGSEYVLEGLRTAKTAEEVLETIRAAEQTLPI